MPNPAAKMAALPEEKEQREASAPPAIIAATLRNIARKTAVGAGTLATQKPSQSTSMEPTYSLIWLH